MSVFHRTENALRLPRGRRKRLCSEEPFRYPPLRSSRHIRVLRLAPGQKHEPLQCALKSPHLMWLRTIKARFKALSYTWGRQEPSIPLYVWTRTSSGRLLITKNLASALSELREPKHEVYLWVDAVCIDQSNLGEKNAQVRIMGDIYATALEVIVWLGSDHTRDAELAFHVCREVYNQPILYLRSGRDWPIVHEYLLGKWSYNYESCEALMHNDDIEQVYKLLRHPWFNRTWTIQEVAKSYKATLRCGPYSLKWEAFAAVLGVLEFLELRVDRFTEDDDIYRAYSQCLSICTLLRWTNVNRSLLEVMALCGASQCTDDRDRVYAFLSLADDAGLVQVDYAKSVAETYNDLAHAYLRAGNLNILGFATWVGIGYTAKDPMLKTYVPDWRTLTQYNKAAPNDGAQILTYNAATRKKAEISVGDDQMLRAKGYLLDVVDHVCNLAADTSDLKVHLAHAACRQFLHKIYGVDRGMSDHDSLHLLRTLIANDLRELESTLARPLSENEKVKHMKWWLGDLVVEDETDANAAIWFHRRLLYITSGKALFSIPGDKPLGIGPATMQKHDIVCILLGGPFPYVLRPIESGYEFVGYCYIDHLMNGELLKEKERLSEEPIWFDLS